MRVPFPSARKTGVAMDFSKHKLNIADISSKRTLKIAGIVVGIIALSGKTGATKSLGGLLGRKKSN